MPTLSKGPLVAIALSDVHLSLRKPACRADKDWLEVQSHYLKQVREIAGDLPILFAGDLFDRWDPPPELIHFALQNLPDDMLCVPGQHDLPHHRIDQMHRSGYGVLKEAGKIQDAATDAGPCLRKGHRIVVYGFGWGQAITPPSPDWVRPYLKVALVHRYCWTGNKCYPGAPEASNLSAFKKELRGYDIAIFGDNHIPFTDQAGDCVVLNVGGFIRRRSNEISRCPCIGLIYQNGSVEQKQLDTSIDVFHTEEVDEEETTLDLSTFISGLESLGEHGLNFLEAVENHLRKEEISPEVKEIIKRTLN